MVIGSQDFKVIIRKEEVVAPVLPLQDHWLPMSNLDLLLPPLDVGLFFCYKSPPQVWPNLMAALKKALAQALVSFYPFAGEIVTNSAGEPEIRCDNRGVDFIEAFADVELEGLDFYNPDDSVEGKLVPKKKRGVLSVQVTELKCGGLVVGCTFDHRASDAYSINMFMVSWAAAAANHSASTTIVPSFRRSLLNPRRPAPFLDPSFNRMYVPISTLPPPPPPPLNPLPPLASRIYHVDAQRLTELQAAASEPCPQGQSIRRQATKLEAFTAFLWKSVAKASPKSDSSKPCRVGIVVDGRQYLPFPSAAKSYFGNVLSVPFTEEKTVGEVTKEPLEILAGEINRCIGTAASEEHFTGLVDWVEALRPEPGMTRIYSYRRDEGPAFVVSSGRRFPVNEVDFGFGQPVFGSYHFPWGGDCGYVMPMPSPNSDDWLVYMHLFGWQLEAIEKEASHVFKPLTFDCLNK